MKRWPLFVLGGVLAAVALDLGHRALTAGSVPAPPHQPGLPPPQSLPYFMPNFKVGDPAPDFALPDRTGADRRLSDLVHRDTLLFFTCGCAQCEHLQRFTAKLLAAMGDRAPQVVCVSTMPPDREDTWYRDTKMKQTVLYERKGKRVMDEYRGHPCPRVYRLDARRRVSWIGPSPGRRMGQIPLLVEVGLRVGENLGFDRATAMAIGRRAFPGSPVPAVPTTSAAAKS